MSGGGVGLVLLVSEPHVHAVLLAGVEVVEPGREQPPTAQLTTLLVRDDIIGIVASSPVVAKRANQVPVEPRGRREAEVFPLLVCPFEHLVQRGLVESVRDSR